MKYTSNEGRIKVVLVEPEYERNVGAIARLMKNFGLSDLRVVSRKSQIGSEAIAYSMHGSDVLKKAAFYMNLREALVGIDYIVGTSSRRAGDNSNLSRIGIELGELQSKIANVGNVALVFGRESKGLRKNELQLCDTVLTIKANPEYPVLNVVSSAAIIFHSLHGNSFQVKPTWTQASYEVKLKIMEYFTEIMDLVQYPPRKRELATRALRNVMGRSSITKREASLIVGVLRRAKDRLSQPERNNSC